MYRAMYFDFSERGKFMLMMKEVSKTCVLNMIHLVLRGNSCYFFILYLIHIYLFIFFIVIVFVLLCFCIKNHVVC